MAALLGIGVLLVLVTKFFGQNPLSAIGYGISSLGAGVGSGIGSALSPNIQPTLGLNLNLGGNIGALLVPSNTQSSQSAPTGGTGGINLLQSTQESTPNYSGTGGAPPPIGGVVGGRLMFA